MIASISEVPISMALAHGISVFVWMLFFDIQKVMVSSSSSDHGLQTLI